MAADQRYCLNCGNRRGAPRLPFMDAVAFMEATSGPAGGALAPPPPPAAPAASRMNANAALIAGVATLVLAIGVGFLIGRSGHAEPTQAAAPQVIKVEGGGGAGGETAAVASPEAGNNGNRAAGKSNGGGKGTGKSALKAEGGKATAKAKKNSAEGAHGQSEAVENVLHTEAGVELESEVEVGGKCKQGTAGCEGGKFTGNFFGE